MAPEWVWRCLAALGVGFEGLAMPFWSKICEIWESTRGWKIDPGVEIFIFGISF